MNERRRRWLWILLGIVIVGVVAWYNLGRDLPAGRISWSNVTWSNLERFKTQLARDLPRGTPQQAVESYCTREGIPFEYDSRRWPSYRKPIVIKKNLAADRTNLFDGGMQLYVVFDHEGAVADLEFHQQRI